MKERGCAAGLESRGRPQIDISGTRAGREERGRFSTFYVCFLGIGCDCDRLRGERATAATEPGNRLQSFSHFSETDTNADAEEGNKVRT